MCLSSALVVAEYVPENVALGYKDYFEFKALGCKKGIIILPSSSSPTMGDKTPTWKMSSLQQEKGDIIEL
jgi:hypothetical protein